MVGFAFWWLDAFYVWWGTVLVGEWGTVPCWVGRLALGCAVLRWVGTAWRWFLFLPFFTGEVLVSQQTSVRKGDLVLGMNWLDFGAVRFPAAGAPSQQNLQ